MSATRSLFSKSALIFAARISGAGIIFLIQAFIAKKLGADGLGQYVQAMAVANILAGLLPLGFHSIAVYFAAEYASTHQGLKLKAFLYRTYFQTLAVGLVMVVAGKPILHWFYPGQNFLSGIWYSICFFGLAIALMFSSGNVLVALKRPLTGLLPDLLLRPLLVVFAVVTVLSVSDPQYALGHILWLVALTYGAVSILFMVIATRAAQTLAGGEVVAGHDIRRWWRFAAPWILIGLALDFFFDIDVILLSGSLGYSDLAIFGVAAKIYALGSFAVSAIYSVSLPGLFDAHAQRDRVMQHMQLKRANRLATAMSLAMLLGVVALGPFVLGFFGPGFSAGAVPMAILFGSLVVRSIFGPGFLMLSLHDRPYAPLVSIALGFTLLLFANFILVPRLGLDGAALSVLLSVALYSGASWYQTLRMTHQDVSIFAGAFKPLPVSPGTTAEKI